MTAIASALPPLSIGQWTLPVPIIQGGMGVRVSAHRLASAVACEGGLGIIASVALSLASRHYKKAADYLKANKLALADELAWARERSPFGVIGVNCMVAVRDYEALVRTAVEHGAQVIISGAGLPLRLPEYARARPSTALVPIVSSVRAAKLLARRWWHSCKRIPEAIVFEEPSTAGGHLGARREDLDRPEYRAENVLPELVEWSRENYGGEIPIILAGGVWDRADIDRALKLGAKGVQMASRFICTHECDADIRFKEAFLDAEPGSAFIVDSPAGLPGRALKTSFTDKLDAGEEMETTCTVSCLKKCRCRDEKETFCIAKALHQAQRGNLKDGLVFTDSKAPRHKKIVHVREIFDELCGHQRARQLEVDVPA